MTFCLVCICSVEVLLYVKAEQHDVAVLHHIFLAFQTHQSLFLGSRHRAARHQIVIGDNFGTDESLFEIGVDLSGSLGAFVPLVMVHARTSCLPAVR